MDLFPWEGKLVLVSEQSHFQSEISEKQAVFVHK